MKIVDFRELLKNVLAPYKTIVKIKTSKETLNCSNFISHPSYFCVEDFGARQTTREELMESIPEAGSFYCPQDQENFKNAEMKISFDCNCKKTTTYIDSVYFNMRAACIYIVVS